MFKMKESNCPSDAKVVKVLKPNPRNSQNASLSSIFFLSVFKDPYDQRGKILNVIIYP